MSSTPHDDFDRDVFDESSATVGEEDALILDLEGFEGPLDLLLSMAREQKVDLLHISILALADQYLSYIARARRMRLEIAADYLVMAAWLAYIKSRLLLPKPPEDEEPSGPEMASALAFRLRRYEAMKDSVRRLIDRPQLDRDFFKRGEPMRLETDWSTVYEVTLYDLLQAYGQCRRTGGGQAMLRIVPARLYSMDEALKRLSRLLTGSSDWIDLQTVLADASQDPLVQRSALASGLAAGLELARDGKADIRQDRAFGSIYLRGNSPDDSHSSGSETSE